MDDTQITDWADEVERLMAERLRIRGRDLSRQIDKAGRLLPKAVRRDARYLAEAARLAPNPKLRRMIDVDKAARAHAVVTAHLATIDPKVRARTRLLRILAVIAFNVLLIGGLLIAYLVWRGVV